MKKSYFITGGTGSFGKQLISFLYKKNLAKKIVIFSRDEHKQLELHNKDLSIYKSKFKRFVMPYRLVNGQPRPFKSDPKKAHSICGSPDTPILYKNKLYKCAPIANLVDLDKTGNYKYKGFTPVDDIKSLVENINVPESVCSMCPEDVSHSVDHFDTENVIVKNFPKI